MEEEGGMDPGNFGSQIEIVLKGEWARHQILELQAPESTGTPWAGKGLGLTQEPFVIPSCFI